MKFTSLYVFIALGALLIGHTSAAPIPGLAEKLITTFLGQSKNSTAEAEAAISDSDGNQVDALIQVAFDGIQAFFDGMNEALAEEQQNSDRGRGYTGYDDTSEADIARFTFNMLKLVPQLASGFFG